MAKKKFLNPFSKQEEPVSAAEQKRLDALQAENRRLTRALEELSMLNELAREIGASRNTDVVMDRIINRSLRAVNAEQAVITLVDEQNPEPAKTLVRAMVTSAQHDPFHVNQNLLGWMHLNKKPLVTNDPRNDDRFRGITWDASIRSILCVPLMVKSKLIGVLNAYNKKSGDGFTDEDQRLLAIIAMQSGQVIETARLYEEEQKYIRMQEEVRLAAVIQEELLPDDAPVLEGYDIAGRSIPAQQVGGDYYDFIPCETDGCMAICLGDVSGKGLPASLLMANLQATLRSQTLADVGAAECIQRSNRLLHASTDPEKFATLFYGVLNASEHRLAFSNAGHENPYLVHDSNTSRLATGGTVLGVVDGFPFEEETVDLAMGSVLVIFSDGITEAFNMEDEQYGEERLAELLKDVRDLPSTDIIDRIIADVTAYAGEAPQTDDLTVVVVKRVT